MSGRRVARCSIEAARRLIALDEQQKPRAVEPAFASSPFRSCAARWSSDQSSRRTATAARCSVAPEAAATPGAVQLLLLCLLFRGSYVTMGGCRQAPASPGQPASRGWVGRGDWWRSRPAVSAAPNGSPRLPQVAPGRSLLALSEPRQAVTARPSEPLCGLRLWRAPSA